MQVVDAGDVRFAEHDDEVALADAGPRGGTLRLDRDDEHAAAAVERVKAHEAAMQRDGLARDADEAARDAAVADQPRGDEGRGIDSDGEADPLRLRDDGRVDADHIPAR